MIHEDKEGPLAAMSVRDFVMTVGARSATPGGGSVAALVASLVSKPSPRVCPGAEGDTARLTFCHCPWVRM